MQLNAPKFTFARRYAWGLLGFGLLLLIAGVGLLLAGSIAYPIVGQAPAALLRALGFFGAALLAASAGLIASACMAFARRALAGRVPQDNEVVSPPASRLKRVLWRSRRGIARLKITAEAGAGWLQTALSAEQSWRTVHAQLTAAQVQLLRRTVSTYKALGGGWSPTELR